MREYSRAGPGRDSSPRDRSRLQWSLFPGLRPWWAVSPGRSSLRCGPGGVILRKESLSEDQLRSQRSLDTVQVELRKSTRACSLVWESYRDSGPGAYGDFGAVTHRPWRSPTPTSLHLHRHLGHHQLFHRHLTAIISIDIRRKLQINGEVSDIALSSTDTVRSTNL